MAHKEYGAATQLTDHWVTNEIKNHLASLADLSAKLAEVESTLKSLFIEASRK